MKQLQKAFLAVIVSATIVIFYFGTAAGITLVNSPISFASEVEPKHLSKTITIVQEFESRRRSYSFSAGQIQMNYKLLGKPSVGTESELQLTFELPPQQNLQLNFNSNEHIELMQSYENTYIGTDSGIIKVVVKFKSIDAGKTYLKFIASTANGEKIRAFAVTLPIANSSGIVPVKKKITKSRINLPSS